MASFEEDFLDFLLERRTTACNTMLNQDTEQGRQHAHYTEKHSMLEKEIFSRLGSTDEAFSLLFDLADVANLAAAIEMDAAYIQGMQDGFSLMKIFKEGITWPASRDQGGLEEAEGA